MKSAIQSIIHKQRDARYWQCVSLALITIFTAIIIWREAFPKPKPSILILSEHDYRVAKLQDFSNAIQLHRDQAKIATLCLLQRSPRRLDYARKIEKLFSQKASQKVREMISDEQAEFQLKSLHQKVEIEEIKVLQVRGDVVLTKVTGQLIRTGNFEGESFIEVLKLELDIRFIRNPNIVANGYYPSVVTDFEFQTTPIASP